MNKYILRTSLVWLLILVALSMFFVHRSHFRSQRQQASSPEVLASGPDAQADSVAANHERTREAAAPSLAPVQLTPEQMHTIGVQTASVEYKRLSDDIRATGTVAVDERLLSYVQVRFSGYIRKVFADATFQYIHKGQPLFTIYSPDLVTTQQELLLAKRNEQALSHSSVEGVAEGASTLANAAEQRLRQWNIPSSEVAGIASSGKPLNELTISSEVTGYVTERNAVPELYVEPSTRLYTVADLSRVWVNAQVYQEDAGRVKPGDPATITVDAYPAMTFHARVEQILPQVDPTTRTIQVRLAVQNPAIRLKPGMYVNVLLKSVAGAQLTIPASAIFQTGTRQVVFVDAENGTFTPRDIMLGATTGSDVVVLSGLKEHDRVATSANFLLDSESQLQAAAGSSGSSSTPSSSSANQPPLPAPSIVFSTAPDPPQKGTNTFRVRLTDASGNPVEGAQVTVNFYMAAMPAMGMAAMKTTSTLASQSGGMYVGTGELGSGGTWQVTITASQNGRTLAVKQLRVNATGGM